MRRILVIGGTGAFGERLVRGLVSTTDLVVIIAARRRAPVEALAAALRGKFPQRAIETAQIDTATLHAQHLRDLRAWLVVDAAGPFQGTAPRVAEAAIAAGCHYVDLADARDFVAAFPRLDAAARAAGVLAVTGASSTPALSHVVLDDLTAGWRRIDSIDVAISPGNRQPRGLSVVQAILARAGQPLRVFRGGRWITSHGMSLLRRPHMPGLGRRWLFLIDAPDLDLLPQRFAPRRDALWSAGLELGVLHLGVWALSRLVVIGALRSLLPLARPLRRVAEWFRPFGRGRGGMTVTADGIDAAGTPRRAVYALIAHEDDGPHIPILTALALIRALAAGRIMAAGARPCVGLLALRDVEAEFARFRIVARRMQRPRALFDRALGAGASRLPASVRDGHAVDEMLVLAGRASIEGAASWGGRLVARLFGFPRAAPDVPVRVEMRAEPDGEIWVRTFAGKSFSSHLRAVRGRRNVVAECFWPFRFHLALRPAPDGLDLILDAGWLGPLRLPRALLPASHSRETEDTQGRFTFDVPIALPLLGRIVHYRGWLVPEQRGTDATPAGKSASDGLGSPPEA